MLITSVFLGSLLLSAVLTRVVRVYSLKRGIIDRPSERGLHDAPVARGGGAAIVISVSVLLLALMLAGALDPGLFIPWTACGVGFGLLGWVDDHIDLSAAVRLVCQLALAVAFCLVVLRGATLELVPALAVVGAAVAMVWVVNLYNFMDGADGFAACEALVVAGAGAAVVGLAGGGGVSLIAVLIAGSSAGFLYWNWSPARIFMGDVGSYFLGFQFGALVLHGATTRSGAWVWLILLAPFITDASLTLVRRIIKREQWWRPHRTHVYQRLILGGWGHARVCVALLAITIIVLVPAALVAARYPPLGLSATVTIYGLAVMIWLRIDRKIPQPG